MEQAVLSSAQSVTSDIPDNVDPALVVDFDYMNPAGIEEGDVFAALARLHEGPDVQWSPHYGGHWIFTRAEDIKWVQESWQIFSSTEKAVPKGRCPFMPPITFDPPDHSRYRAVLNPYFAKRRIEDNFQEKSRAVIAELIENIRPKGACEFVEEFAFIAPLRIFFGLVDIPFERRDEFLTWGHMLSMGTPDEQMAGLEAMTRYMHDLLDKRLEQPGDDIFTGISQWRNNPRYQHRDEIDGMARLIFVGGQDTVASQMSFSMLRLAERPELQQRLKDDPEIIPAAVEELLRRHALSITARLIMQDIEHKGASLKAGDMVLVVNPLSGVDTKAYDDAFTVDFDRGPVMHNTLGNGPHKCVGQHLAWMEMRVLLEEWARRMPIVRVDPGKPAPRSYSAAVIGMKHLHLAWDA